jgi:hypothetical protein
MARIALRCPPLLRKSQGHRTGKASGRPGGRQLPGLAEVCVDTGLHRVDGSPVSQAGCMTLPSMARQFTSTAWRSSPPSQTRRAANAGFQASTRLARLTGFAIIGVYHLGAPRGAGAKKAAIHPIGLFLEAPPSDLDPHGLAESRRVVTVANSATRSAALAGRSAPGPRKAASTPSVSGRKGRSRTGLGLPRERLSRGRAAEAWRDRSGPRNRGGPRVQPGVYA